jgi:hypothetical protein
MLVGLDRRPYRSFANWGASDGRAERIWIVAAIAGTTYEKGCRKARETSQNTGFSAKNVRTEPRWNRPNNFVDNSRISLVA